MLCTEVEQYLHQHIPISKHMAVSVVSINETGVILSAPLLPNINHRSTVFGGSICTLAILSAWTLLHVRLQELSIKSHIVIQSNTVNYLKPIESDFYSHCLAPLEQQWKQFIAVLSKKGKGRIILSAEIISGDTYAGKFQGEYVAFRL